MRTHSILARIGKRTRGTFATLCVVATVTSCAHRATPESAPAPRPAGGEGVAAHAADIPRPRLADRVVIRRDAFGVPHVRGETDAAAVFGFMYARAEDEFERIERSIALANGEAARHFGEPGLPYDVLTEMFDVNALAEAEYASMPDDVRALCDAAAEALEYYAAFHVPASERRVERFDGRQFVAAGHSFSLFQAAQVLPTLQDTPISRLGVASATAPSADGSNAWALGPAKTDGANALLYANPHIPLHEVYEGHIASDSGWNVSGMTAYGSWIFPILGFNERLGWTLTVNYPDLVDAWRLTFDDPERPRHYKFGDGYREAETWTASFDVRTPEGIETREVELMRTHHGPILGSLLGSKIAVNVAGFDRGGGIEQFYRMGKATSYDEFRRAVARTSLVFHNVIYADADGRVFYVYNGAIPKRDPRFPWGLAVDGSDPEARWDGYLTLDELPQVLDPEAGFVQNCNSSPFTATRGEDNPDPASFAGPVVGRDADDPRVAMSFRLIEGRERHSLDDLARAAFDNYAFEADRWIPEMVEHADEVADPRVSEAIELLAAWDRRVSADSEAATVFVTWAESNYMGLLYGSLDGSGAVKSLATTLEGLVEEFGSWRVRWGDAVRHQRPDAGGGAPFSDDRESHEIAGGHAAAGVSFNYLARATSGTSRRYGYHGHSYVAVVSFGDRVEARSIVPYGQSRDPDSPHYDDQTALFARGEMKSAWLYEEDVLEHTVREYRPGR